MLKTNRSPLYPTLPYTNFLSYVFVIFQPTVCQKVRWPRTLRPLRTPLDFFHPLSSSLSIWQSPCLRLCFWIAAQWNCIDDYVDFSIHFLFSSILLGSSILLLFCLPFHAATVFMVINKRCLQGLEKRAWKSKLWIIDGIGTIKQNKEIYSQNASC